MMVFKSPLSSCMRGTYTGRTPGGDATDARRIVESSGFLRHDEVDIAMELVTERLVRGPQSGYEFLFAEIDAPPVGYACFGHVHRPAASTRLGAMSSLRLSTISTHRATPE
jgi:hypothetical protein